MTTTTCRCGHTVAAIAHPDDPYVTLGALDYWTSDAARAWHGDVCRLERVDALMAASREAVQA